MDSAIEKRRSIRKFSEKPLARADIEDIIRSGILAPSSKNRQPWKFVVVQGAAKKNMLRSFAAGIAREESGAPLLPESARHLAAAKHTVRILERAPVVIFVLNALGTELLAERSAEERIYQICNIQSVSAAVQNMILRATEKGIGSLWVCDIFFAYQELRDWLDTSGELLCAVAFGYSEEAPAARPRNALADVTLWRET